MPAPPARPGLLPCMLMLRPFGAAGYDKVMHMWQLNAQGFQLVGHPGAWVVHRPHSPSAGYLKAFTGPRYTAQHQVHMVSGRELYPRMPDSCMAVKLNL